MKKENKISILYGLEAAAGGALKHLSYLVTHLDKACFEVTVILSPNRPDCKQIEIEKLQRSGIRIIQMGMVRAFSPFKDLLAIYKLFRLMRKSNYDIIHAHSSKAGFIFRIAAWLKGGAPVIYTPHCFYFQSKTGVAKIFYCWVEKLLGFITSYLVVSNDEKDHALQYNIVPANKIININNAIKFNEYCFRQRKDTIRHKLKIPDDSIVIGSISRLTEQKDLVTYIHAAKEVTRDQSNVVFLIVGEGELHNRLQQLIHDLQLQDKVLITGHYNDISDIFPIIDIFVSTSLWEGLPYVMLEAMWFKKPIVASNLGYKGLVYNEENGFLVKAGDYKVFADNIKRLLKNRDLIKQMGEKGHLLVNKHFNFENFIRQHENFYKRIVRR